MTPLVIANWKMHGSQSSLEDFAQQWRSKDALANVHLVLCPPFPYLALATKVWGWQLGAQDCSPLESGAYTGDVAAPMLVDVGCQWVILGHSERRGGHGETDDQVAVKAVAAVASGLQVVVCVGETLEERDAGRHGAVVTAQLAASLEGVQVNKLVVAYEPIWAIGTGQTATPDEAESMHVLIRQWLQEKHGNRGKDVPVIYGGSVKPDNAAELFARDNIDGALVGGASLEAGSFWAIASAASAGRK